jgi:hypothetical protein
VRKFPVFLLSSCVISILSTDFHSTVYHLNVSPKALSTFQQFVIFHHFQISELYLTKRVPDLFEVPTPLEFSRDYVGKNCPVVIRNACMKWPAIVKWNSKYLRYLTGFDSLSGWFMWKNFL